MPEEMGVPCDFASTTTLAELGEATHVCDGPQSCVGGQPPHVPPQPSVPHVLFVQDEAQVEGADDMDALEVVAPELPEDPVAEDWRVELPVAEGVLPPGAPEVLVECAAPAPVLEPEVWADSGPEDVSAFDGPWEQAETDAHTTAAASHLASRLATTALTRRSISGPMGGRGVTRSEGRGVESVRGRVCMGAQ